MQENLSEKCRQIPPLDDQTFVNCLNHSRIVKYMNQGITNATQQISYVKEKLKILCNSRFKDPDEQTNRFQCLEATGNELGKYACFEGLTSNKKLFDFP